MSEEQLNEALSAAQRRQRSRIMKRLKSRIKLGQQKAKRRFATPEKLKNRARKAARKSLFKKLTKGIDKSELTFQRRQEIEKRLESPAMKTRIDRIAKKLLPAARKQEQERHRGKK